MKWLYIDNIDIGTAHGCRPGKTRKNGFPYSRIAAAYMKATVELPDELARRVKAEAALHGQKLKDLVEEGLRLVLETPRKPGGDVARPTPHDLMKGACGVVDSGIEDLASDPKHLKGFGNAPRRHR